MKETKRVKFHLPGLRYNYPVNMLMVSLLKTYPEYFREGVEIASFFGEFPSTLWNGGRFQPDDQCDERFINEVIRNANNHGVPIRYTYTNPILTKEDVNDPYGNYCLKAAHEGYNGVRNEVLVFSPYLEEHIRKNYPNFVINSTTCKEIKSLEGVEEELKKDYGLVVLDYNLNNNFEFLEKISDKKRCEVLVNSCCPPNCKRRGKHYIHIAEQERNRLLNRTLPADKQLKVERWDCPYAEDSSLQTILNYPTVVLPDQIWEKYVPMGFENFKIEGRNGNLFNLVETYVFYMIRPEYQIEARSLIYVNLANCGVLRVIPPRRGEWPSK